MAERKVKIPVPPDNRMVDGSDVPIASSDERWSEYVLEDGAVIRAKVNAVGFVRVDGQYDPEGNPLYAMRSAITQVIVSVPDHLRRKIN